MTVTNPVINRMQTDVVHTAKSLGAEYSEKIIEKIFQAFGDRFIGNPFMIRTTTKQSQKAGCNFRYLEEYEYCLAWEIAKKSGFISDQGRAVDRLVPEVFEAFPMLMYGVDFEVDSGLAKIWYLTKGIYAVEQAFKIPSLPKSVAAHADFFEKFHLDALFAFAFDFQHNSINLYFDPYHSEHKTSLFYKELLQYLEFNLPSDEVLQYLINTAEIGVTFHWSLTRIERICFYVPFLNRETVPPNLDPLITKFAQLSPASMDNPSFILGWSFGPQEGKGTYIKIDVNYNDGMPLFFKIHNQPLPWSEIKRQQPQK
jgi:hypothetical protein